MRPELEQIEKIEKWLDGRMAADEKTLFEEIIASDATLRHEIQLQQDLRNGLERASLVNKISKAKKKFKFTRYLRWGLGVLTVLVLLGLLAIYFTHHTNSNNDDYVNGLPELNEKGEKLWADADSVLPAHIFNINANADTVLETKSGIIMTILANSFLDENENHVDGNITLILKEALDPTSIMTAGLSTKSGDDLLETGGMFFIDARKKGEILKIDPAKSIYVQIPSNEIKEGMQLFSGEREADGSIDWVNPAPLENELMATDIRGLDFYPPHYLERLSRWDYNVGDKQFTDSLYYAFSALFQSMPERDAATIDIEQADTTAKPIVSDSSNYRYTDRYWSEIPCGINPAKIKAIWNDQFQNTIISTREFETRLQQIHTIGNPAILDLYVDNINKSVFEIDSMAAGILSGADAAIFLSFAKRKDGKVNSGSKQFELLKKYYKNKTTAYTEAIAKTQQDYLAKQIEADNQSNIRKNEHNEDSLNRILQNLYQELEINLKNAYGQLGYDTAVNPKVNSDVYRAQVPATGWYNVDRYVVQSTLDRTTLTYTDPENGKTAIIKYQPVSIQVNDWAQYERLYVYLLPDELLSFQKVEGQSGAFTEKLNELMRYDLVCLGYKAGKPHFFKQDNIRPGAYNNIPLRIVDEGELKIRLESLGHGLQAYVRKESAYLLFEVEDHKRIVAQKEREDLMDHLANLIFPCWERDGAVTPR
jgi:hypothetical protein